MGMFSKPWVLVIALAICASGIHAQKRQSSSASNTQAPKLRSVRAVAGDTLHSIAERFEVPAAELARINNLPVESRLKKGQRLRVPSAAVSPSDTVAAGGEVVGQRITFTDGGTLKVDSVLRKGDIVWFTRGKVTESSHRTVKSIEPIYAAKEVAKQSPAEPAEPPPTLSTWIYLVGGARVKVDQVNETEGGAWYSRNNLSVFLAKERIDHIARDEPDIPGEPGRATGWSSGSSIIDRLIRTNGARFGVDPYLVFLVIEQESHFRPRALSPKGAQGLMQLMPGTARRFGVRRPFDPVENIRGGTQYLKQLLQMFDGRVDLALASYNAGEGRVIQYGHKIPPFRETQDYVRKISRRYGSPRKKAVKSPTQPRSGE